MLHLILTTVLGKADVSAMLKHILGGDYDPHEIFPVKADGDNPDTNAGLRNIFELMNDSDTRTFFKMYLAEVLCEQLDAKEVTIVW
ncbi:MAG TPA: hypothetical protein VF803_01890 [Candidatus Paceibacterota bacterium]